MGHVLRVLHSLQRKIDVESAFGYYEWAADLGTHTSKTAIISKGMPRAALWEKSFSSNHGMARTLFHSYELQQNSCLCN